MPCFLRLIVGCFGCIQLCFKSYGSMEDIVIQRSCSLTTYHLKVHIQTLTKQAINQFLKFWGMMHHEILVLHCKNFRLDVSSKCEALLQPSKLSITVAGKNKTESQNLQHSLNSVVSSYLSHPNYIYQGWHETVTIMIHLWPSYNI